jgi:DNA sulfur modification protein DndD
LERDLEELEDQIVRADNDLDELDKTRNQTVLDLRAVEEQLSKVESIKEAFYQRKALEEGLEDRARDLKDAEDQLRARLDEIWWLPLASRLRDEAVRAQEEYDQAIKVISRHGALTQRLDDAKSQQHRSQCQTCGQPMPADAVERVASQVTSLEGELAALGQLPQTDRLSERAKRLRPFLSADGVIERIQDLEGDIRRTRMRMADSRSQIADLTAILRGNRLDIAALEAQLQEHKMNLHAIEDSLEEVEQHRTSLRGRRVEVSRRLADSTPAAGEARAELQVLSELQEYVESAVRGFREAMRGRVQVEASKIFRDLTTEESYAGLRIDGNYYLHIVDDLDRVISRRSAGADQIVTMSLIGALARCSVEEGPIVMDTPFGRLDKGHRGRILRWVAALGNQVILFVQSGEFERDRDLSLLGSRVGREFRLTRLSATTTRIEAL